MNIRTFIVKTRKKLTLFDWIFIIFGVIIIFSLYFFFRREAKEITVRFKVAEEYSLYTMTMPPVDDISAYASAVPNNEFSNSFSVGDTEKNELGSTISEIVGIEKYKISPGKEIVYLDIKLKTIYSPRKKTYSVRGKNILFGESFMFSFQKVKFKALVVNFPGFKSEGSIQNTKTRVKAQLRNISRGFSDTYGVPEYIANAVKRGDSVTDSKGDVLIKVLDVSIAPAKRLVVTASGQSFLNEDPYLKDVYYTLEISTKIINGKAFMFDYQQILTDSIVPLNTKTASVFPRIIEIYKNDE